MRDERLTQTLKELAGETRPAGASGAVRAALASEVRKLRRPRYMVWVPALSAAALLAIGFWIGVAWRSTTPTSGKPRLPVVAQAEAPDETPGPVEAAPVPVAARPPGTWSDIEAAEPVTPWYWHTGLPPAPGGRVVVMEVSPDMARQFGLPAVRGAWRAQVVVGDDGLTRAVRLVGARRVLSKGE